jgi:hypothetical protein
MSLTLDAAPAGLNQFAVTKAPMIQAKLRQGLEFENLMTPRSADRVYSAPNATSGDLVQPYQWQFTPNNADTISAEELYLRKIKLDIQMTADDLEKFWDSYMVEWHEIGKDPIEWSFPRYMYEQVYLPKILEEMNKNAWSGIYSAPTPGSAGLSVNSVDGYKKKIEDAVTAGDLTEYATGALVESTMVSQIESWIDSLPIPYRDAQGSIYMSPTNAKKYFRNYRSEFGYGAGVDNNANAELRVEMTNKRIVPINAMEGSNRILFFPATTNNMIWVTRRNYPTYFQIRWEKDERVIKGLAEIYRAYGFEFLDHLFVNDQA